MPARDDLPEDVRDLVYRQAAVIDRSTGWPARRRPRRSHRDRSGSCRRRLFGRRGPLPSSMGLRQSPLAPSRWLRGSSSSASVARRSQATGLHRLSQPRSRRHLRLPARPLLARHHRPQGAEALSARFRRAAIDPDLADAAPREQGREGGARPGGAQAARLHAHLYRARAGEELVELVRAVGREARTEFYFRRWYTDDSVVSIEFIYPKELAPVFAKLVPIMTQDFTSPARSPKLDRRASAMRYRSRLREARFGGRSKVAA
jgi:hypothetical protein